jgi:hypothetical protein
MDEHAAPARRPRPFSALYEGWCRVCEESFDVGDEIVRIDPSGPYVHADCADRL